MRFDIRKRLALLAIGIAVGFGGGLILLAAPPERPQQATGLAVSPTPFYGIGPGQQAPDFELVEAVSGEPIRLSDLRGSAVLLNFWATWCSPCEAEMPLLQQAFEVHQGSGLRVLGINYDEPAQAVIQFAEELELSFPLLLDPGGEVQGLYRVRGYPTSVLVDQQGVIRVYQIGILASGQLQDLLELVGIGS